jgi:integrase/recombinase XerD
MGMKTSSPCGRLRDPLLARSPYRKLPLVGPVVDDILTWLRDRRYAESTLRWKIYAASFFIRWLQRRCGPELNGITQKDFRAAWTFFRKRRPYVACTVNNLAGFFRERQLVPEGPCEVVSISERELATYCTYLREVRGMAESTIEQHRIRLRFFLRFLGFDRDPGVIGTLDDGKINSFLRKSSRTNNRFSLQHIVAALRGFLRHQHALGKIKLPLYRQIDTTRTYRLEQLPRSLPWAQVVTLLRSIDRSDAAGLRDFTLLYMAARYGLRSGELVRLTLDDIDWRAGTLHVAQTKTRQRLQLPLTDEAGHILTNYLRSGRPVSSFRELFLRRKAPHGPLKHTAVHDVLEFRIGRSGLDLPAIGTHALRHSLAVHLLRRGVSTKHIGDVLGHRYPESTAVYLRLAVDDLREVGLSVPKGGTVGHFEAADWRTRLPRIRPKVALPLVRTGFHSGLSDALQRYLALRRALGRRYAGEEAVLRRWDDFLRTKFRKVCQVRAEMFNDWAETMPNLHSTVRRNRLRVVRNFLLFHGRQHPNTFIPDLDSFPKPSPSRPPRLVSTSEMAQVLAAASKLPVSHQNSLRPQTVGLALLLLFCCGLRRGELLRLQWKDCDLEDDILHIEATKFHKSRLVPMSSSVARTLRQYQQIRQQRNLAVEPSDHLIWSCNPIASQTVYSAVALADNWRFLCLMVGILDERGRPPRLHDLRHSFAVARLELWYKAGKNPQAKLPYLAAYLGHINPVSTHHYLHLTPELQEVANRRFHQYAFRVFAEGGVR